MQTWRVFAELVTYYTSNTVPSYLVAITVFIQIEAKCLFPINDY